MNIKVTLTRSSDTNAYYTVKRINDDGLTDIDSVKTFTFVASTPSENKYSEKDAYDRMAAYVLELVHGNEFEVEAPNLLP
jgi:hypothetical protein